MVKLKGGGQKTPDPPSKTKPASRENNAFSTYFDDKMEKIRKQYNFQPKTPSSLPTPPGLGDMSPVESKCVELLLTALEWIGEIGQKREGNEEGGTGAVKGGEVCVPPGEKEKGVRGGKVSLASHTQSGLSNDEDWKTAISGKLRSEIQSMKDSVNILESELDQSQQLMRKGTLIVSSPRITNKEGKLVKESQFKKLIDEKKDDDSNLVDILDLVEKKYGVKIPLKEVYGAHWLPNNSYVIKILYRNPDFSCWRQLTSSLYKGGLSEQKELNVYLNFNMTKRRQTLLFHCRQLKRENLIEKYFTDDNGNISVCIQEKWCKITQHYTSDGKQLITTYSVAKLRELVGKDRDVEIIVC